MNEKIYHICCNCFTQIFKRDNEYWVHKYDEYCIDPKPLIENGEMVISGMKDKKPLKIIFEEQE